MKYKVGCEVKQWVYQTYIVEADSPEEACWKVENDEPGADLDSEEVLEAEYTKDENPCEVVTEFDRHGVGHPYCPEISS